MQEEAFSVSHVKAHLELRAPDGSEALYTTEQAWEVKEPVQERWFSYAASGEVSLKEVSPGHIERNVMALDGQRYLIRYDPPLQPGLVLVQSTVLFINSFRENNESFGIIVESPTSTLSITVVFPHDMLASPMDVSVKRFLDKEISMEEIPEVSKPQDRFVVFWEKAHPVKGAEYRMYWQWKPKRIA